MFEDISHAFIALRENNDPYGTWELEWVCETKPETNDLTNRLTNGLNLFGATAPNPEWQITTIEDKNWLEESYKQFPAFEIGPFFIHGSHCNDPTPADKMPLQIDAATAFGTGEHGTTKGCLEAMLKLKDDGVCPWNVLDMGTGSGILAIAAWKLWQTPILAIDNDAESIRVSKKHQTENGVSTTPSALTCLHGDGYNTPEVTTRAPYDLIIANILAAPLIEMAPGCRQVTDENGYVILSGMLIEQVPQVQAAYEAEGFTAIDQADIGAWSTLVLQI